MSLLILDPWLQEQVIANRRERGIDQRDEVWDGIYIVPPTCDNEHQRLLGDLAGVLWVACKGMTAKVFPGVNVSDRDIDWMKNFRCPDVVVALNDCPAVDHGSHWVGGLSFIVEIISEGDRSRDKLEFYEKVGVQEVLLIDRFPWALELYRLDAETLQLVGKTDANDPKILVSANLPLTFQLQRASPRPLVKIAAKNSAESWTI